MRANKYSVEKGDVYKRQLFACIFPDGLEGKHLLLVDDVLTTGATVVSCADAFRGIPGVRISVLTLALAGEDVYKRQVLLCENINIIS